MAHKYFELSELLASSTALSNKIENLPSWEVIEHLDKLTTVILDPLREAWGSAVNVSSGYRSSALNTKVGGSSTSAHLTGYAADLIPNNGKIEEFISFAIEWAESKGIKFDQMIDEKDSKGSHWLHVGLYNNSGQQRCQTLKMTK